jgi:nitroreductase
MEFKDVIENRMSVREFAKEPISEDDLKEMVRLAGLAPSVNNYQPWKFIAVLNTEMLNRMAEVVIKKIKELPTVKTRLADNIRAQVAWYSSFFEEAPALLALAVEPYESVLTHGVNISNDEINTIRNYPDIQSAGACIQNLLLAAVDLGYGGCWLSGPLFARKELETILNIENPWELMTFVAIGKPKGQTMPKNKRNLGDELHIIK